MNECPIQHILLPSVGRLVDMSWQHSIYDYHLLIYNVWIRQDNRNYVDKEEFENLMIPRLFEGGYCLLIQGHVSRKYKTES